jgi:serine/threonine protein kinase
MPGSDKRRAYCPECDEEYAAELDVCPEDGSELYYFRARADGEDELVGMVLDERFELERVLGEGGMGKVYLAEQLSVKRPVAVKVMREALVDEERIVKRFFREARVISGFSHPNIVKLIDFGQDDERGLLYLVMELIDGVDLSELLAHGRLSVPLAIEVGKQVCAGLSEPHADDIVHRDLKPENLFISVTTDGSLQVKILDFGIAHALQHGDERLTGTNMICGTAHYMAPEQARSASVGPPTDVYSLGVVLYEALCGRLPFDAESAMKLMVSHVQVEPPKLVDVYPGDDLPDGLSELVDSMLAKLPSDRPASVLDVRDELEAIERRCGFEPVRIESRGPVKEMFGPWLGERAGPRASASSAALIPKTGEHASTSTGDGPVIGEVPDETDSDALEYALAETMGGAVPDKLGGRDEPETATPAPVDRKTPESSPEHKESGEAQSMQREPAQGTGLETMVRQSTDHRTAWTLVGLVVAILISGAIAVVLTLDWRERPGPEEQPGPGEPEKVMVDTPPSSAPDEARAETSASGDNATETPPDEPGERDEALAESDADGPEPTPSDEADEQGGDKSEPSPPNEPKADDESASEPTAEESAEPDDGDQPPEEPEEPAEPEETTTSDDDLELFPME